MSMHLERFEVFLTAGVASVDYLRDTKIDLDWYVPSETYLYVVEEFATKLAHKGPRSKTTPGLGCYISIV